MVFTFAGLWYFLLGIILTVGSYFSFYFKKKSNKRKGNFLSIAPLTKK
jgi:hypothetical protein